jgi:hypothetical protein
VAHRGLHPQIVDLIEAAAVGRESGSGYPPTCRCRPAVFGGLEPVGDELHGAADGVDAGAVFRRLDLSTSIFQSMPGSGWPSSRSRMSRAPQGWQ